VDFMGQDIYAKGIDPVAVRRHIGMVFQQPNPFSMSIYENVAFGLRLNRLQGRYGRTGGDALTGRPLERGQGQAEAVGPRPLGRSAAAPVHRAGHCDPALRAADG
jgi:ABC-type sugar transport system ATPase subunit